MNISTRLVGKSVLTIDDSATIRIFLRGHLSSHGAQVDQARNGAEGLAAVAAKHYDLILLDLLLPDLNGIEVLKGIRKRNSQSSIVMLTGLGGIQSATAAVRQGADGYIEKQELGTGGDLESFFYALEQAMDHRAGLVALQQLEEVRADFYSMVTHDLRNPTGALQVVLEMLLNGDFGPLAPDQTEAVEMGKQAADRLFGLINDYLDYAKIDAGYLRLTMDQTDIGTLVENSVRLARVQANVKHQALTLDLPPEPVVADADGERLKQVLDNLISNAIKYSPEGGQIRVQLRTDAEDVVLQVSDTGSGIPASQLSSLFTKYHRVPGEATRGITGTGLGLLIVKEIAEAHGGGVSVESTGVPGEGTTFIVKFLLQHES